MADALYNDYKNAIWGSGTHGTPDWDTDTIRVTLTDHGTDTPAPTTDVDYADISGGDVGTPQTLTSVTIGSVSNGTVDAANPVWTSLTGASVESYTYYEWSGSAGTSPLMLYIDAATGLPLTPNGGNVTLTHHTSGIIDI